MDGQPDAVTLHVNAEKVAWLTFDLPGSKMNLLTTGVMRNLDHRLGELESHIATGRLVALVIQSGKPGTFVAGADVKQISALVDEDEARKKSREGQRIFRRLERLTVPTIAAVDGLCLGGGTELILSCRYRIASDGDATKIGLPEVRLGILPGFGGSVRLPRLCGIQNSLRMILTGKPVSASRAKRIGLVDRVAPHDRFDSEVEEFLRDILAGRQTRGGYRKSTSERLLEETALGRRFLFSMARRQANRESKGRYPAPTRVVELVEDTYGMPMDEALAREAQALAELSQTNVSRSLIRLFLLQRDAKRALPSKDMAKRKEVRKVAVLGAGVMGGSIAELIVAHDVPTVLKDIQQEALDTGLQHAHELLDKGGQRGVFSQEEVELKFSLLEGTLTYDKVDDADMVIEAVVERMAIKQQVLRETEEHISEDAVLATNTSSLSVTELAAAAAHPDRVVGLHFFNPVHRMPLVEVVRTEAASPEAVATAFGFALDMGKTPVLVADGPGFLVNRILGPYLNETGFLIEDGVPIGEIDGAMVDFGMPMGPCRLLDEIGFDIAEHVAQELQRALAPRLSSSPFLSRLRGEGRLGKKNGRGFYRYEKGREKGVDREVAKMLAREFKVRTIPRAKICRRCLYPMVNEAAYALAENIVADANDVDLALVTGTGFPPFRGGLLQWADEEGISRILEGLEELEARHGERFSPSPLLRELAEQERTFTQSL